MQVFTGADVFDGARMHQRAALVVEEGCVAAILPEAEAPEEARIALAGGTLAPGFIDLQVNGGGGVMLNDAPDLDGIRTICAAHGRLGTTGLLPTLITDRPEVTRAAIAAGIAAAAAKVPGFLGLHIEGPHLDPRRKGAHDPTLIRPMQDDDLALLCHAAATLPALLVTLAPASATREQVGVLSAAGAVVSLGHSDTGIAEARAYFAAGARSVTHLFNAMSPLTHREPGLVGAALDTAEASAGLIADGVHVAPEVMRIALAAKRGVGIYLVTDAMAPAGTDMTEFTLNGRRILRRDGRLTLDDGTLAGADVDFAASIRTLVSAVGISLDRALAMATALPAEVIGIAEQNGGHLSPGAPADLVHLDPDLSLAGVWRAGSPLGN
jgi:N-acetylglucosamine-6-phosphate deacetylase